MLQHLLPVLIPSWRFFDRIGPAPYLEYGLTSSRAEKPDVWHEVRPRPARMLLPAMLGRLFWNPRRNESLYLVSCAERLLTDPTEERADALWMRVADIVLHELPGGTARAPYLRIRIVQVTREGTTLARHIPWVSEARPWIIASRQPS